MFWVITYNNIANTIIEFIECLFEFAEKGWLFGAEFAINIGEYITKLACYLNRSWFLNHLYLISMEE